MLDILGASLVAATLLLGFANHPYAAAIFLVMALFAADLAAENIHWIADLYHLFLREPVAQMG